jgi:ABC-type multidrug transport system fused ATPase/permease subunit
MLLPGFIGHARKLGYEPRWVAGIFLLQVFAVLFEGISVGIGLPILQFINSGNDVEKLASGSRLWRWMLDGAIALGVPLNLPTLLIGALACVVLRQVFFYLRDLSIYSAQFELQRRVRDKGFDLYIHASLDYHDRVRAGDFVNELTTELQNASACLTAATTFIGYALLSLVYVALAAVIFGRLTIIATAVLLFATFVLAKLLPRMRDLGANATRANQEMSSFLVERLKSVRLVRLSGVEDAEESMLMARTREQRNRQIDRRKMLIKLSVLIEPIVLSMAFVLIYISVTIFKFEIERIILFLLVLVRLVPILKEVVTLRQGYIASLASVEVVESRLSSLSKARDPIGGERIINRLSRDIEFRDVSFAYENGDNDAAGPALAINHLSLSLAAHRTTALVGPSGAGKSTLVDLLPRLREPQSGQILFDGVPQKEFSTVSLRRAISFAPQVPQLFNVTITEHIRYGWPEATMDDVRLAARLAQAANFIEALPDGYDTMLGEGGGRFSGGQRQRIDLARAVARRAPILILDEPTSNLDSNAETLFREALEKVRRETDITIIIIGHRLSTVMSADRIVVLNAGRVAESGTHNELLALDGWYARAFAQQHRNVAVAEAS